jgi:hypothetical protein
MNNHSRCSLLSTVSHSRARFCRLPRVRKANGHDFCSAWRPEAWRVVPSNPSAAPCFHAGRRTAIKPSSGWRLTAVGVILFHFPSVALN